MKNRIAVLLSLLMIAAAVACADAAVKQTFTAECCYVKAECAETTARMYIDGHNLKKQMPSLAKHAQKLNSWHEIAGTRSRHKVVAAGIVGQDTFPYLLFLREDGRIEYVNVNECIESGVFKVKGIIAGLKGVAAFQNAAVSDDEGGYLTIYAIHSNGRKTDLSGLIH